MITRRALILGLCALALPARAQGKPALLVYKSPGCGCCGEWEKHMRAHGFAVESRLVDDIAALKRKLGVPDALASCHTGIVAGYVLEGHVPAQDVRRLLRSRTKAIGLAVPGMPVGAPGMEQGPPQKYATLAFDARHSWVFERH